MAAAVGPGELTSIAFGATTVTSDMIEGFSGVTEPDSFSAAIGYDINRGSVTKKLSCNVFDVGAISAIHTLMTGRTESAVTVTYQDGNTQVLDECIIRIMPLLNNVTDVCKVLYADSAEPSNESMTAYSLDLGVTIDVPTVSFEYSDGVDGLGRPYFSTVMQTVEFTVPLVTLTFGASGSEDIVQNELGAYAFLLPDDNYQVHKNVRSFVMFGDEDGSAPRTIKIVARGIKESWGDLIEFTDGAVTTPTDEDFNASTPTLMQDYLHGFSIEVVGFGYAESDLVTF